MYVKYNDQKNQFIFEDDNSISFTYLLDILDLSTAIEDKQTVRSDFKNHVNLPGFSKNSVVLSAKTAHNLCIALKENGKNPDLVLALEKKEPIVNVTVHSAGYTGKL